MGGFLTGIRSAYGRAAIVASSSSVRAQTSLPKVRRAFQSVRRRLSNLLYLFQYAL